MSSRTGGRASFAHTGMERRIQTALADYLTNQPCCAGLFRMPAWRAYLLQELTLHEAGGDVRLDHLVICVRTGGPGSEHDATTYPMTIANHQGLLFKNFMKQACPP